MIDALLSRPDPVVLLVITLVLSLVSVFIGYVAGARYRGDADDRQEGAFGLGQSAIFGLIALILAFSFSFAAERFEARRALVVQESVSVGDVYARADFLPPAETTRAHALIREFTQERIGVYQREENPWLGGGPHSEKSAAIQSVLWKQATALHRADPRDLGYARYAEDVDTIGDLIDEQAAAINNHVPAPIFGIVIFCTLLGAALLGIAFGRAKAPNRGLSIIFCLLFAATVYTIVDLDHPRGGLIHIDERPLQNALASMR